MGGRYKQRGTNPRQQSKSYTPNIGSSSSSIQWKRKKIVSEGLVHGGLSSGGDDKEPPRRFTPKILHMAKSTKSKISCNIGSIEELWT